MTEQRLPRIAMGLQLLATCALVLLPLAILWAIAVPSMAMFQLPTFSEVPRSDWSLVTWIGLMVGFLPAVFFWLAVNKMRSLFALYRLGDPLAPDAGPLIKSIGGNLMIGAILIIAVVPVQSLLMSLGNPVGQRSISISLNSSTIGFILVAGLLSLIGWSMSEATKIAAENREFV